MKKKVVIRNMAEGGGRVVLVFSLETPLNAPILTVLDMVLALVEHGQCYISLE